MNTLHTALSLSLLLSLSAALTCADKDPKIVWPAYKPSRMASSVGQDHPSMPAQEAHKSCAEKYPITMALIQKELQHATAVTIKDRARQAEHDVIPEPAVLTLKTSFNETMQEPLAQKIITLVTQKELQRKPNIERRSNTVILILDQNELDEFTKYYTHTEYDIHTESSVRIVNCITTLYNVSDLEALLAEAEKGANQ
jgi:hypothetical protein